jgi:nucleotide-binding universal stress UspA family protein
MKTNLLLLDSSKNIEGLISYAFSLSNITKRKLKIGYVYDLKWMYQTYMSGSGFTSPNMLVFEKRARKEFDGAETNIREKVAEYIRKHTLKVPFEIVVTESNRLEFIRAELQKEPNLMLIISNHLSYVESGVGIIGYSNIIEKAECPVIVIPENISTAKLKDVVYVTNYNPEDITSLKHLTGLMKHSENSHLTILHNDTDYDYSGKLKWTGFQTLVSTEIELEKVDFSFKLKNELLNVIEDYLKKHNIDLLVLLKEKKGFFEQIFGKHETKHVLTHLDKPVLVYHEK